MASNQLSTNEIYSLLEQLSEKLREKDVKGKLVIGGGAVMAMWYNARQSTVDVDGIFSHAQIMREAVAEVARENNIEEDWLNDGIKGFINPNTMKSELFYQFPNLTVYRLDDKAMLALKLLSARVETDKDLLDSVAIMHVVKPESEEELLDLVEEYAPDKRQLTARVKYFIEAAYSKYLTEISMQ